MRIDACEDVHRGECRREYGHRHRFMDTRMGKCIEMCIDVYTDTCETTCVCVGMCLDVVHMCLHMCMGVITVLFGEGALASRGIGHTAQTSWGELSPTAHRDAHSRAANRGFFSKKGSWKARKIRSVCSEMTVSHSTWHTARQS